LYTITPEADAQQKSRLDICVQSVIARCYFCGEMCGSWKFSEVTARDVDYQLVHAAAALPS